MLHLVYITVVYVICKILYKLQLCVRGYTTRMRYVCVIVSECVSVTMLTDQHFVKSHLPLLVRLQQCHTLSSVTSHTVYTVVSHSVEQLHYVTHTHEMSHKCSPDTELCDS